MTFADLVAGDSVFVDATPWPIISSLTPVGAAKSVSASIIGRRTRVPN